MMGDLSDAFDKSGHTPGISSRGARAMAVTMAL